MEEKMRHLEMIQGIINRLASNSFSLKGWAVTLVAAIFAIASRDAEKIFFLIVYIPIIVFWGLDSYYLMQERLDRNLYSKVTIMKENEINFSMNVSIEEFQTNKSTWINCVFSITEVGFYLPLALICGIVSILALAVQ